MAGSFKLNFFCRKCAPSQGAPGRRPNMTAQNPDSGIPRVAFRLRIKPDAIAGYENDHAQVWPELLAKLKEVGISDYSIFRRGQDLVLVMRVKDFDAAWDELANDPVNLRWQAEMAKYFEPVPGLQPGERVAMMKEVFYMEWRPPLSMATSRRIFLTGLFSATATACLGQGVAPHKAAAQPRGK